MFLRSTTILCILLLLSSGKEALQAQNIRIETALNYGKIIPHRSYFTADVTQSTKMYELSFAKQGKGDKAWHHLFGFPLAGVNIVGIQFGDSQTFGKGIGAFPFIQFDWNIGKIARFDLRVGSGLAWIDNKYDEVNNPTNNAISTNINNMTRLSFGLERDFTERFGAKLMFSATHFSNGNTHQPNLGINLFSGNIGIYYWLNEKERVEAKTLGETSKQIKVLLRTGYGKTSGRVHLGEYYDVFTFAAIAARPLNHQGRLLLGVQYEYNESISHYGQYRCENELDENECQVEDYNFTSLASKVYVLAGYEMRLGRLGMTFQAGVYLHNQAFAPVEHFKRPIITNLIGVHYYLKDPITTAHNLPYLQLQLKSHGARADYVSAGFGWEF